MFEVLKQAHFAASSKTFLFVEDSFPFTTNSCISPVAARQKRSLKADGAMGLLVGKEIVKTMDRC